MRNIEIVELLLDKGAKVSAVDKVLCKNTPYCKVDCFQLASVAQCGVLSSRRKVTRPSTSRSEGEAGNWPSCC